MVGNVPVMATKVFREAVTMAARTLEAEEVAVVTTAPATPESVSDAPTS